MAHFELSYITDAGTITHSSKIYSEANGQRFVDWIWIAFPQLDINNQPLPRTQANEVQAFRDYADDFYGDTKTDVLDSEKQIAAQEAVDNVPPLDPI